MVMQHRGGSMSFNRIEKVSELPESKIILFNHEFDPPSDQRISRRLRRFRAGYASISEDLQTCDKGNGRRSEVLQSVARISSKF
jgi:hypothetical protein